MTNGADWNDVARSVGRKLAAIFISRTPYPPTPREIEIAMRTAASAAIAAFEEMTERADGPAKDQVDDLAATAVVEMIKVIDAAAEREAKR